MFEDQSNPTQLKSFFLISNYKKKLIAQLSERDRSIIAGMKKAKKFNFSKNVIKQFLKTMLNQILYVYEAVGSRHVKNLNPLSTELNDVRNEVKVYLTSNSYTHSSIKKIIMHPLYSLYFSDFLDNHTSDWNETGKTKYKSEQDIMIDFLKLCLKNRHLLIFLSEHDPDKHPLKKTQRQ